ncbi:MAG: glycosyltransferase [Bacteroidetes bacterium]|nr:glycosyltransferase [Bacteroidota bacterium]
MKHGRTILFLTPRYPWPLIGGDRVKAYHLLRHLAAQHNVILVTFNHGDHPTPEQRAAIEGLGVEVHAVPLAPLHAALASARTFTTDLPLEITFYTRPDFRAIVDNLVAHRGIDLGISFFMRTAEYLRPYPALPKILIAEDCRVEYQTRSTEAARSPIQKLVRWWETRQLLRYEPVVIEEFDVTTFVSPEDITASTGLNERATYALVTNGVDMDRFAFHEGHAERHGLLFAGKLDVLANHLMATTIIRRILPSVREAVPNTTLTIAGAGPRRALRALATTGIRIDADVPDLVPYFHRAAVFVHPHHGGSGIQNKVLEAMATGCPVVTTPSGLQGIEATHGVHAMIGTTPEELAAHVITILRDEDLRATLARNARQLMVDTHSWSHVFEQMDGVIASVLPTTTPVDIPTPATPQPSAS